MYRFNRQHISWHYGSSFQLKNPVLLHTVLNTFLAVLNSLLKKWKKKSSDAASAVLYEAFRQIHVSEAQFACNQVKTNTTRD